MHPIALQLGSRSIHWYGVMVALAFVSGIWTASRRGLLEKLPPEKVLDIGPWLVLGGLVGARIFYVITFWREEFAANPFPEVFMVQHGGLVFYGGLIGAALCGILYARVKKLPVWKLADVLAPSIALGSVFGRIGCLLNGCCYGRGCSYPWAIRFPLSHETGGMPVHPTEIYDAALNLALYVFLAWLYRRKKFDGQILALYLVGYAVVRSFVEYFRGDYPVSQIHAGLTPAQVVSIFIFFGGLALYRLRQINLTSRSVRPTS